MGRHRTLEEKIEIIYYKVQGHSISQVAKKFGISHSTVCEFYKDRDEIRAMYYAGRGGGRTDGLGVSAGVEVIAEELMPRKVSADDLKKENRALRAENEYLKDKVAYLEALYEVIRQDPASVMKKKRFSAIGKAQGVGRKNIRRLCGIAGVSPKCYYQSIKPKKRDEDDARLLEEIARMWVNMDSASGTGR